MQERRNDNDRDDSLWSEREKKRERKKELIAWHDPSFVMGTGGKVNGILLGKGSRTRTGEEKENVLELKRKRNVLEL